jgi:hypothetical protein
MGKKRLAVGAIALLAIVVGAVLLASASLRTASAESHAQKTPPANAGDVTPRDAPIPIVDSDWSTDSMTSDCAPNYAGWGDDQWQLTLTSPRDVIISVNDGFCPGDFYQVYLNGGLIGITPDLKPPWGCDYTGPLSAGAFRCSLAQGTYLISVRDAGLDGHTPAEIEAQDMCPAAYTVAGMLSAFTGQYDPCVAAILGPVGGIAELPPIAGMGGSPSHNYAIAAVLAFVADGAFAAGGWYARRRWLG